MGVRSGSDRGQTPLFGADFVPFVKEKPMFKRVVIAAVVLMATTAILLAQGRGAGGRGAAPPGAPQGGPQKVTAVRAGRLVDPDAGTAAANQIILVEGERITNVVANLPIPQGAEVIDLSALTVLPGLVD